MHFLAKILIIGLLFTSACSFAYGDSLQFSFSGIQGDALKNVTARLDILKETYGKNPTAKEIQSIYQHAAKEISKALEPYGYFKPKIQSTLTHKDSDWTATFKINTGAELKITTIDIKVVGEGANNKQIKKFIENFPLKQGEIFQTENYEKAKEEFFNLVANQGYVKTNLVSNKILIDVNNERATIIMHLDTGHRYYFGEVSYDESAYDKSFLNRFISFKKDEAFSSEKLVKLQQALNNSFYFRQASIIPDFIHVDDYHIPIHVEVTPPKSQRYQIGVGYGTFTGPRLTAGLSLRRLTSTGQHFDAQLKLSPVLSGVTGKYYIPGSKPLTDQWILGANYQKFNPKHGESQSSTLTFGYVRTLDHLQAKMDLNYLFERYSINNLTQRNSQLLYPNLDLTYTEADDLVNPTFGKSININIQAGSHELLSTTNFLRGEIKAKYIFSPTYFSRIILRGDLGYIIVNDLKDLPLTMRFFAGGVNSLRGYTESSIGPGRFLETGSIEYQNKIYGNWKGALFYDIGTASNHFNEHFKNSTGVGLIYESFIGPIKLYVAKGKSYGFEFSIGPEF